MYFAAPKDDRVKNKRKRKDKQILGSCQRTKKAVKHKSDSDTNCICSTWNDSNMLGKRKRRNVDERNNRDHLNFHVVENDQNTETSPGDRRRLVVTRTPVKDNQPKKVWGTRDCGIIIIIIIITTALLRTARILRRVLETWGGLLSLKLKWKTIS